MSKQISHPFCSASPQLPHNLSFHLCAQKCPLPFVNIALTTLPYTLVHPNAAPCNQSALATNDCHSRTFPLEIFTLLQGIMDLLATTAARMWLQRGESMTLEGACHGSPICIDTVEWYTHQSDETLFTNPCSGVVYDAPVHRWSIRLRTIFTTCVCTMHIHGREFIILWSEMANGQVDWLPNFLVSF